MHRGKENDVATRPVARQAQRIFGNWGWALAYAGGYRDVPRWVGGWRGLGLDRWGRRRNRGGGRVRLGKRRSLADTAAMASGLVAAVLLAVGCGPVALTGQPAPPTASGVLADRATVACLGSTRQKPAFTSFEQAAATAGMPTARTKWLTRHQRAGKLRMAHGRDLLPSGQAAGSCYFPPPPCADNSTVVANRAARSRQTTRRDSCLPSRQAANRGESQSRDRQIAGWLKWLFDNGSGFGCC